MSCVWLDGMGWDKMCDEICVMGQEGVLWYMIRCDHVSCTPCLHCALTLLHLQFCCTSVAVFYATCSMCGADWWLSICTTVCVQLPIHCYPKSYFVSLYISSHFLTLYLSLSHTHTHSLSLSLSHTHTLSLPLTHTHTHTHTHTLSLSHTHTYTHSLSLSLCHTNCRLKEALKGRNQ